MKLIYLIKKCFNDDSSIISTKIIENDDFINNTNFKNNKFLINRLMKKFYDND